MTYGFEFCLWPDTPALSAKTLENAALWARQVDFGQPMVTRLDVLHEPRGSYSTIGQIEFPVSELPARIERPETFAAIKVEFTIAPFSSADVSDRNKAVLWIEGEAVRALHGKEPLLEPPVSICFENIGSDQIDLLFVSRSDQNLGPAKLENQKRLEDAFSSAVAMFGADLARVFAYATFRSPPAAAASYFRTSRELAADLRFVGKMVEEGLAPYNMPPLDRMTETDFMHFFGYDRLAEEFGKTRDDLRRLSVLLKASDEEDLEALLRARIPAFPAPDGAGIFFSHEPFLSRLASDQYLNVVGR